MSNEQHLDEHHKHLRWVHEQAERAAARAKEGKRTHKRSENLGHTSQDPHSSRQTLSATSEPHRAQCFPNKHLLRRQQQKLLLRLRSGSSSSHVFHCSDRVWGDDLCSPSTTSALPIDPATGKVATIFPPTIWLKNSLAAASSRSKELKVIKASTLFRAMRQNFWCSVSLWRSGSNFWRSDFQLLATFLNANPTITTLRIRREVDTDDVTSTHLSRALDRFNDTLLPSSLPKLATLLCPYVLGPSLLADRRTVRRLSIDYGPEMGPKYYSESDIEDAIRIALEHLIMTTVAPGLAKLCIDNDTLHLRASSPDAARELLHFTKLTVFNTNLGPKIRVSAVNRRRRIDISWREALKPAKSINHLDTTHHTIVNKPTLKHLRLEHVTTERWMDFEYQHTIVASYLSKEHPNASRIQIAPSIDWR
ncbi:hypothetical protein BDV98DRAFT_596288 [Pterulicium gracile]|uniref:Uncharacterized protein n=1 Tax=Pterulicium gracile TaxID=1884261 RepID=A0A5C3QC71_9AGAR|nr:hypothetical protein BDV98DRAFT_596288 [Pterula gracilis]